jgi:glycosyltransferase involved in cell wall biosynthesis
VATPEFLPSFPHFGISVFNPTQLPIATVYLAAWAALACLIHSSIATNRINSGDRLLRCVSHHQIDLLSHAGFFGSLEPRKDIDGLLRTFGQLTNTHSDLHLVPTGLHGLEGRTHHRRAGAASPQSSRGANWLPERLRRRHACVMRKLMSSKNYEGIGLPLLEAAGKTRVVLSDTPMFHEVAGYLRDTLPVDIRSPADWPSS